MSPLLTAASQQPAPSGVTDPEPRFGKGGPVVPAERGPSPGVLLLYHYPTRRWFRNASTILEHVGSFSRHSRFPIWEVNTAEPMSPRLAELDVEAILLHYSLFSPGLYAMTEAHAEFVRSSGAHKVAFFQDENRYCRHRFWFIDEFGVDTVYTCLEPEGAEQVYGRHTSAAEIRTNIPGYVGEELLDAAERFIVPEASRPVDVGYRGRPIPAYSGRGGLEKAEIGTRFLELAGGRGLMLDIATREEDRLYGDDWFRFIAGCRAVLGVESGTSVFDVDDVVVAEYERLAADGSEVTVEDLADVMEPLEGRIHYRTISPRHFEAAALRVCQILFEGHYSGRMEPMVHYIPLRKDFSNLDQVIERFRDPGLRAELIANAHRDLIASGRESYAGFVADVDGVLSRAGVGRAGPASRPTEVEVALRRGRRTRRLRSRLAAEIASAERRFYLIVIRLPGGRALAARLGRMLGRGGKA
ncbi:MAG: hypothetical protein FJW90_06185 [Actinobacteria bacterium]|nr:hypothetical protein [Actinomycetota bacterium]